VEGPEVDGDGEGNEGEKRGSIACNLLRSMHNWKKYSYHSCGQGQQCVGGFVWLLRARVTCSCRSTVDSMEESKRSAKRARTGAAAGEHAASSGAGGEGVSSSGSSIAFASSAGIEVARRARAAARMAGRVADAGIEEFSDGAEEHNVVVEELEKSAPPRGSDADGDSERSGEDEGDDEEEEVDSEEDIEQEKNRVVKKLARVKGEEELGDDFEVSGTQESFHPMWRCHPIVLFIYFPESRNDAVQSA
jgi:hypothetical protein